MRFNRVLLLAASINLAVLATVFTLSCSGDKGSKGDPGASCTISATEDSYVFTCDGESVGEVPRGSGGGQNGEGCSANKVGNTVQIICGGVVQGTLNDCSVTESDRNNEYEALVSCGNANFGLCYGVVFDPSTEKCREDKVIGIECGDGSSLKANEYCGYASRSSWAYDSVLVDGGFPRERTTALPLCGNNPDQRPNEDSWKSEYCRWYNEDPKSAKVSDELCDDGKQINGSVNQWLEEYCGYAAQTDTYRSIIGPGSIYRLCDDAAVSGRDGQWYRGPNELAFGAGYCQAYRLVDEKGVPLLSAKTGTRHMNASRTQAATRTRYSEEFCGKMPSSGVPGDNIKVNEKTWKGQFCGYKSSKDVDDDNKTRLTTVCDDGIPNENGWEDEYCEAYRLYVPGFGATSGVGAGKDTLILTRVSSEYCEDDDKHARPLNSAAFGTGNATSTVSILATATAPGTTWKREYCGMKTSTSTKQERIGSLAGGGQGIGVCLDGTKPNESSYVQASPQYCRADKDNMTTASDTKCDAAGSKINVDSWKKEYCGYASGTAATTTVMHDVCDDGQGPNASAANPTAREYCAVLPDDVKGDFDIKTGTSYKTSVSSEYCGTNTTNRLNENTWQGHYCGYANTTTDAVTRQDAICADGTKLKDTQGETAYCRVMSEGARATKSADFCGTGTGASNRMNELQWKRQFCFDGDSKVGTCNAGWQPVGGMKSNDAHDDRCEVIGGYGSGSDPNAGDFDPLNVPYCLNDGTTYSPTPNCRPNCGTTTAWYGLSSDDWKCTAYCTDGGTSGTQAAPGVATCPQPACGANQEWTGLSSTSNDWGCKPYCNGLSNSENPRATCAPVCQGNEGWASVSGVGASSDWGCMERCPAIGNPEDPAGACAAVCDEGFAWVGTSGNNDWGCKGSCKSIGNEYFNPFKPDQCGGSELCEEGEVWMDAKGGITTSTVSDWGCRAECVPNDDSHEGFCKKTNCESTVVGGTWNATTGNCDKNATHNCKAADLTDTDCDTQVNCLSVSGTYFSPAATAGLKCSLTHCTVGSLTNARVCIADMAACEASVTNSDKAWINSGSDNQCTSCIGENASGNTGDKITCNGCTDTASSGFCNL